jgi:hypothetical protein
MTDFDSNTFEHDYIIRILSHFADEMRVYPDKHPRTLDKYAGQLTAFMNGKIVRAVDDLPMLGKKLYEWHITYTETKTDADRISCSPYRVSIYAETADQARAIMAETQPGKTVEKITKVRSR